MLLGLKPAVHDSRWAAPLSCPLLLWSHSTITCAACKQVNIYKSLQDIAAGMDYLHTVGVLHGDLKGANVLLKSTATDPRGFMCKLADFGLSRVLDLDMTHISTHTYGTISYMPPELLSQGKMTRACDVYSFGMLSKFHGQQSLLVAGLHSAAD